ncbi:extracellular protein 6 [Phyllosticta citribraziliensis]|uniref:Extracellular protein 6 n=1 Tax=Phyllosticta citribraziliensis TaxID=989973 RepID=A0ABR1LE89_9PEZI
MRLITLVAAGASLLGFAAAMPEAYPDAADLNVVGRLGKRALINNLETRELCNGSITLDTTTQTYVIPQGDTLTKIAEKFNRGICDIAKFNNISNPDYILAGATLIIPPQVCFPDSTSCISTVVPTATCINGGPGFYIIQSGDTLGALARAFNITLDALTGANKANIPNPDVVNIGQVVNIPICDNSSADLTPYKIKAGDTFYILGRRYRSSEGAIRAVNPGVNPNTLQVDQVITLVSFARKFPGTEPTNEL